MKIILCEIRKCCLNCKFCISQRKNIPYGNHFSLNNFKKIVNKLIKLGYNEFDLTPQVGDILENPSIIDMLYYLESNPYVISYGFSTNLIYIPSGFTKFLLKSKKNYLDISLYGWDVDSYKRITNTNNFFIFFNNLKKINKFSFGNVNIYNRTEILYKNFPKSPLRNIIEYMVDYGASIIDETNNCNWGGYIDIEKSVNKEGICRKLFDGLGVFPNGDVTICGCWDVYGEMIYTNILKKNKIKDKVYCKIVENQQKGIYTKLCKNCNDFENINEKNI